jgi:hypothetical protein
MGKTGHGPPPRCLVLDGRPHGLAADHTLQAHGAHQALDSAACDGHAFP